MKNFFLILGLGFSLAAQGADRFLGYVEIPKIQGVSDPDGPPGSTLEFKKSPVNVYNEPKAGSQVVKSVSDLKDLSNEEYDYDRSAVNVYERKDGWYKVRLADKKSVWLSPKDAGTYHSYENIALKVAARIPKWDRKVFIEPNIKSKTKVIRSKEPSLQVKETKEINGEFWFRVDVIDDLCTGQDKSTPGGWIKAHNPQGEKVFEFYTRGC